MQPPRSYTFDKDLELDDGAVARTASAAGLVGGAARQIDLGAGVAVGDNEPLFRGVAVVEVAAAAVDGGDETYQFIIEGGTVSGFGSGKTAVLAEHTIGDESVHAGTEETTVGRYEIPFFNWENTQVFRYIRIRCVHVGATTSVDYSAYVAKL